MKTLSRREQGSLENNFRFEDVIATIHEMIQSSKNTLCMKRIDVDSCPWRIANVVWEAGWATEVSHRQYLVALARARRPAP